MATTGDLVALVGANTAGFSKGMAKAKSDLGAFQTAIGAAKAAVVGFLTIQAARTAFSFIKDSIAQLDDLGAQAVKVGVRAQHLKELHFAAQLSDVSIESLNKGLEMMNKLMGKEGLGGDPVEAFLKIADKAAAIVDPMERAAFVTDKFGKSGQELIGILSKGRAGIEELRNEARLLIGEGFDQMVITAGLADDAMKRLDSAWQGLANVLVLELVPGLTEAANAFTNLFSIMGGGSAESDGFLRNIQKGYEGLAFVLMTAIGTGSTDQAFREWKLLEQSRQKTKKELVAASRAAKAGRGAAEDADALGIFKGIGERRPGDVSAFKSEVDRLLGNGGGPKNMFGDTEDGGSSFSRGSPRGDNAPLRIQSREGFDIIARAMMKPSANVEQQQLGALNRIDKGINDLNGNVKGLAMAGPGPEF